MKKINFETGTQVSPAKVTIDNVDHNVTPAVWEGNTPLSPFVLNKMQDNIEESIEEETKTTQTTSISEDLTINNCAGVKGKLDIKSGKTEQAEGTPSPDNIIPIRNVGDNINLFDKDNINVLNDYYINSTGDVGSTAGSNQKILYITVKPNTTYTISKIISNRFRIFTYTGSVYGKRMTNFKISDNATSLSISTGNDTTLYIMYMENDSNEQEILNSIKIEKGSIATPYTPYNCGSADFKVENRNKIDLKKWFDGVNTSNCTKTLLDNGVQLNFTAGVDAYIGYVQGTSEILPESYRKQLIEIKPSTIHTISLSSSPKCYIGFYDENYTSLGFYSIPRTYDKTIFNFTTPDKAKYITLRLGIQDANYTSYTFTDIQLEEGSTATNYVPHQEQIKSFPFTEGQVLHKGNYLASDGIHKKRDTYVFTGEENWYKGEVPVEGTIQFYVGKSSSLKSLCNCTHFVTTKTINGMALGNFMNFYPSTELGLTTVEKWKSYIAEQYANGTPVTIEYELAEEIVIPYTPEQEQAYYELQHLLMYEGYTQITCIDEIKPDIQGTYLYNNELNKSYGERFDKVEEDVNELDNRNVYSTEEQVIGKWIDGKPLYRKVFTSKTSTSINKEKVIEFADNVREIISVEGNVILQANTNTKLPINMYLSSDYTILTYNDVINKNGRLRITVTNSDCTDKDVIFIVKYTKTTD